MGREVELPLTCNCVVHRQNIDNLENFIQMALDLDAERVEIAQVQYYGWALKNRAAFIPTPEQLDHATEIVEKARVDLKGKLVIDYVIPDYYAKHPKNCMGGWGRRFLNMNPKGDVLPCHAAETIPHLKFDNVREKSLKWIWENSKHLIFTGAQNGCPTLVKPVTGKKLIGEVADAKQWH